VVFPYVNNITVKVSFFQAKRSIEREALFESIVRQKGLENRPLFVPGENHEEVNMQLTRQADYAIRALLHLSEEGTGAVVQTKEIASSEGIPEKYLPTIMRTLARAGLVRTLRGNQGGVLLARKPGEINLREVIEAIEEPIVLNRCLRSDGECSRESFCPVHPVWDRIQQSLTDKLEATTFADLASADMRAEVGSSKGWQYADTQQTGIPA